jgi:hypothetical protein
MEEIQIDQALEARRIERERERARVQALATTLMRGLRIGFLCVVVPLAIYSTVELVRGAPDQYPNEHLRSALMAGAMLANLGVAFDNKPFVAWRGWFFLALSALFMAATVWFS